MQFCRWQLQTAVHHQNLMTVDHEGMAWGPWGLNTPSNHPYNNCDCYGDDVVSCHRENRMEQQEQQNIKRPKMLSIYTWKNRASCRMLVRTSWAYFGGLNSPQINEVPQTAMRASKKGALVVITQARNQWVSQQCKINTFIPWRGKSTVPFWEERQSKVWETVHKWKV